MCIDGFEHEGERYKSLTAVARAITGSHCNGFPPGELNELREDIAEAERFNDPGRLEQLRTEFQKIADELTKSKGKNGQSRITTDAGKSRRNVRQQMQRDINKKIAPQHPDLADHLLKAFKRSWIPAAC